MSDYRDHVPAYQTIKVTVPTAPAAALADEEAWTARKAYPWIRGAAGPAFGVAREREEGGWELLPYFGGTAPQDARDSMGSVFRQLAHEAREAGDEATAAECTAAAERLDWEPLDGMTVLGHRYRVVRAERFIRMGPDGPEPPRPSDPDPARPGKAHTVPDPSAGFVIDSLAATGPSEGILKVELLSMVPEESTVPADAYADAVEATRTHPGGVLLPPTFMTAEKVRGRWRPDSAGSSTTPQGARDALTMDLRVLAPVTRRLSTAEREEYVRAADRLDAERGSELRVAGRVLRIVRVERLVRIGPDGPEGPRPSDPDPQPPVMVHDQQLREQGLLPDEDAELEVTDDMKEFHRLWEQERERQQRLDEQEEGR